MVLKDSCQKWLHDKEQKEDKNHVGYQNLVHNITCETGTEPPGHQGGAEVCAALFCPAGRETNAKNSSDVKLQRNFCKCIFTERARWMHFIVRMETSVYDNETCSA